MLNFRKAAVVSCSPLPRRYLNNSVNNSHIQQAAFESQRL